MTLNVPRTMYLRCCSIDVHVNRSIMLLYHSVSKTSGKPLPIYNSTLSLHRGRFRWERNKRCNCCCTGCTSCSQVRTFSFEQLWSIYVIAIRDLELDSAWTVIHTPLIHSTSLSQSIPLIYHQHIMQRSCSVYEEYRHGVLEYFRGILKVEICLVHH